MTKIRAYGYKEACNRFLSRDILDALGEERWIRQGRLCVFATTVAEAFHHLFALDLEPRSVRELGLLRGRTPEALGTAGLAKDGAVYVQPMDRNLVASVTRIDHDHEAVVIGEISRDGVFVPVGAAQASNGTP